MTFAAALLVLPAGWILLLAAGMRRNATARGLNAVAALTCLAAFTALLRRESLLPFSLWQGAFQWDSLSLILSLSVLAGLFGLFTLNEGPVGATLAPLPFYALALATGLGTLMAVSTRNLATAFLALELVSISGYCLAGMTPHGAAGTENGRAPTEIEAAVKYFLFGATATGFLAFGLALLYAGSGEVNLDRLGAHANGNVRLGQILFAIGLLIKAGAVPFHFWVPDAYTGARASSAAILSTVSKVAALALLHRAISVFYPTDPGLWTALLAAAAVGTMTVGNLSALLQTDLKRMLAWSSVAHTGYILMGILAYARNPAGAALGIGLYLASYTLMGVAAFGSIALTGARGGEACSAETLAGLGRRKPVLAALLLISLVSLAGIPPSLGFAAKFVFFAAAIRSGLTWLAVVAILNALLALYYYLKGISWIYLARPEPETPGERLEPHETIAAVLLASALAAGTLAPIAFALFY